MLSTADRKNSCSSRPPSDYPVGAYAFRDGRTRVDSHDRQSLAIVVLNDCLIGVFFLSYSVVINFVALCYEIHSRIIFVASVFANFSSRKTSQNLATLSFSVRSYQHHQS